MDPSSKRRLSLIGGAVLVLLALGANALVAYRAIRTVAAHNQSIVHTLQVISELDVTLSLMKDAETGQRGYLVTHKPDYLEPYERALKELPAHLAQISKLTNGDPDQRNNIPEMQQLIHERLAILRKTIELGEKGDFQGAANIVASDEGKRRMDELRRLVRDMRQREEQRLTERTADSRKSLQEESMSFLLASLVGALFVVGFFASAKNEIDERARAAAAIAESEAWLRTTLHSIGDAVIATDEKGHVEFINGIAERLLRYSNQEVKGLPLSKVFPIFNEHTGAPAPNPVDEAIAKGAVVGLANHTVLRNHLGEEYSLEDSAAPILDGNGKITGVVLVFRDVTQQRRAEETARTAEKLAAAGRLAATIAHEVNNPLEAAINLLYLANTSDSLEEARRYLTAADHELARMAHVTRKTLTFYRTSSFPAPTNIATLFREVIDIYASQMDSKQIKLEIHCPDKLEIDTVRGNLTQVLSNLVSNAMDAMNAGGRLTLRATGEDGGARLEIEDNGEGIPPAHLKKIFQPFFTTKRNTGTGLGLWVVKDLVEQQGGTITVVSRSDGPQRGTCFSVFLPSLSGDGGDSTAIHPTA